MLNTNLERYRTHGFQNVEGWCFDALFETVDLLNSVNDINKIGGCLEIGVHHGKLYLLLNQVIDAAFKSFAVDVFSNQRLNIDLSGSGSLENFRTNLARFDVHEGRNTEIIMGDSTDSALDLPGKIGRGSMRFISIDGGHTAEHTINDLGLASMLIHNEGVVILDDVLNHHWLGVIEGTFRFLQTSPTLVPFAIGHNKLYLCKLSFKDFYFKLFNASALKTKVVKLVGHELVAL